MGSSQVPMEVATAGQKGLNINRPPPPASSSAISPTPQPVTALQAASLLFLGGLAAFAGAGVGV